MTAEAVSRRRFLRRTGAAIGAGAVASLIGAEMGDAAVSPTSRGTTPSEDPDELLRQGRFVAAERGFREVLRTDPDNAHAAAQVGYIALLSNRFADAERFLTRAVTLKPDDRFSQQQLGDCFVRQDKLERAIEPLRASENPFGLAFAQQYAAVTGRPWQVHGADSARLPFVTLDPLPVVEVQVNGGEPRKLLLDTGATTVGLSVEAAEAAGLREVSTVNVRVGGGSTTMYLGVLESCRMGDIELRNIPVNWLDAPRPALPDGTPTDGVMGTMVFYHFLTTMDYAGRALILRKRTGEQLRRFRAEAGRRGAERLPLWLGGDHFPCTLGSLLDYGPKVVSFDTGGPGFGITATVELAEQLGIAVDYAHPRQFIGRTVYPMTPEKISLGRAVGRNVPGLAGPLLVDDHFKFDTIANFTHEFFKPFAITMDFANMDLYLTGPLKGTR